MAGDIGFMDQRYGSTVGFRPYSKLLKGSTSRDDLGDYCRGIKGNTRSLDYTISSPESIEPPRLDVLVRVVSLRCWVSRTRAL